MADEAFDQERHGPARVGENPADIGKPSCISREDDVGDSARPIGAELDHDGRLRRRQVHAAIGRRRMGIDQRLAAIEFFHHGQK